MENYECDTLEDVAKLYATFDHRKGTRNTGDINRAFSNVIEALDGITAQTINLTVTGLSIATWGTNYFSLDAEVRANLLNQYPEFAIWMHEVIGCKNRQKNGHLYRGAVAAAMFLTWQKAKKDATEFWTLVKDGSGDDHRAADRILHKFLLTVVVGSQRGTGGRNNSTDQRALLAKCVTAWNAWRSGTTTDLKYFPNAKLPVAK